MMMRVVVAVVMRSRVVVVLRLVNNVTVLVNCNVVHWLMVRVVVNRRSNEVDWSAMVLRNYVVNRLVVRVVMRRNVVFAVVSMMTVVRHSA